MIIQCDRCSTKFKLDDSRITGHGVKVRCTKCQNVFIVTPPPQVEEVQVEEIFGVSNGAAAEEKTEESAAAHEPEEAPPLKAKPVAQKQREAASTNLSFDFKSDEEFTEEEPAPPAVKEAAAPSLTFNDIDFSFATDRSKGEGLADLGFDSPGKEDAGTLKDFGADAEGAKDEKEGPESGIDFSFDDLRPKEPEAGPDEPEREPGPEEEMAEPFKAAEEAEPQVQEEAPKEPEAEPSQSEKVIPFSGYGRDGRPSQAARREEETTDAPIRGDEDFGALLEKTLSSAPPAAAETGETEQDEEEGEDWVGERRTQGNLGLIIAALIVIVGGGLIYFTGVIDALTKRLMPPSETQAKTIEIETINGFYAENKTFGKLFVIQARIKNVTDEPQEVKAVAGIIYGEGGEKLASQSVSPGRIVSIDDVRSLPREDLLKPFKDPSGGTIPPKGTVPVMVLFTDVAQDVSEFGLDIVR